MTGPAEREFDRLGRRYAAVSRAVVAAGCGSLGLLLVVRPDRVWVWFGLAFLLFWCFGYGLLILRTTANWPVALDLVVICGCIVTQAWTVPVASIADSSGWVLAVLSMTVVAYQWHTSPAVGVAASVILVSTYIASTWSELHGVSVGWLGAALWVFAEVALSRGLIMLVRRGGRISDNQLAERERVQRLAAVSRARRSAELEYLAVLHDTAAATFLMVGAGTVAGRQPWLAEQARRDLRALRGDDLEAGHRTAVDLGELLAELAAELDSTELKLTELELTVRYSPARTVWLPTGPAEAICDCVREALVNVQRHAGTGAALLTLTGTGRLVSGLGGSRVQVEIRDHGRGFDQAQVSPHRRGIGESITARMQRVGGSASIVSAPGQGTVVRLEWPND